MAIVFSKALSEAEILNSHNNNTVEFTSDNVLASTDCDVDFGSIVVNITPDPDEVFRYNLKEVVKALINSANFVDSYIPDIETDGYVFADPNLYRIVPVTFKVTLDGGSTEETTKNYIFTKSVKQPELFSRTVIDTTTELLAFLLPYEDYSVKSYTAVYHKGFPFDVALYSNIVRTITVENKTNNLSTTLDLEKGVNRIFISDGSQNFTFEDDLPLVTGINEIEFQVSPSEFKTLILEKKDPTCSTYLRYYSDFGSYFYYQFDEIFKESQKTKISDTISKDLESIDESFETEAILGKSAGTSRSLFLDNITERQQKYIRPLITSPRVDLYLRDQFQIAEADSWRGVSLDDKANIINDTKKKLLKFSGSISSSNKTLNL